MTGIVNLAQARKARERKATAQQAAENRVRHGRTKAQKQADRLADDKRQALLDGARKDDAPTE